MRVCIHKGECMCMYMSVCICIVLKKDTSSWMVRGTVVSPAHQGSSPDARIYSWIYFRISGYAYSVGGDVLVDDEAPTMTS